MDPSITLTTGIPASGKSTWAKDLVQLSNNEIVRVNLDDIRSMLGFGVFSKELEEVALKIQDQAILAAVDKGKSVIVDNTHLSERIPKRIKRLFDGDIQFYVKSFRGVSLATCIGRNAIRPNPVPESVIRKMYSRVNRFPLTEEWMNDVVLSPKVGPYNPNLPDAVVCDLDGTLAIHNGRSPYDYSRLGTDLVNETLSDMIYWYIKRNIHVFLCSGRPDIETYRADTVAWLKSKCGFDPYAPSGYLDLLMRPSTNLQGNDADVKQTLFDENIRDKYNVLIWWDDRDRVVRRMRKLNLPVHQVANGNF